MALPAALAQSADNPGAAGVQKADTVQKIVFMRHGEKPAKGLGQLNCQGLNRALALPPVLAKAFGMPIAIFASNPSDRKKDFGIAYDYIRPLATIEPTAIAFGLPVNTQFGVSHVEKLRQALLLPANHDGTVLVAWEHKQIPIVARHIVAGHGGSATDVPDWPTDDFDSLFVVTIKRTGTGASTRANKAASVTFERMSEGLNGQSESCAR